MYTYKLPKTQVFLKNINSITLMIRTVLPHSEHQAHLLSCYSENLMTAQLYFQEVQSKTQLLNGCQHNLFQPLLNSLKIILSLSLDKESQLFSYSDQMKTKNQTTQKSLNKQPNNLREKFYLQYQESRMVSKPDLLNSLELKTTNYQP